MRKYVVAGLLLAANGVQIGCVLPIYDTRRDIRTRQLIYTSEDLRHIPEIWERIWFLDMPDTATPYRTYGGII
jgi:hypothetical protein